MPIHIFCLILNWILHLYDWVIRIFLVFWTQITRRIGFFLHQAACREGAAYILGTDVCISPHPCCFSGIWWTMPFIKVRLKHSFSNTGTSKCLSVIRHLVRNYCYLLGKWSSENRTWHQLSWFSRNKTNNNNKKQPCELQVWRVTFLLWFQLHD